jgi:hypothetical protein
MAGCPFSLFDRKSIQSTSGAALLLGYIFLPNLPLLTRRHPVWFSDAVESFLLLSDQAGYFSLFAIRVTWSPCLQLSHSAGDERDNARKVPTQKNH